MKRPRIWIDPRGDEWTLLEDRPTYTCEACGRETETVYENRYTAERWCLLHLPGAPPREPTH